MIEPSFEFTEAKGIGEQADICRRDPSDVIKVGKKYYVWYSRVTREEGRDEYPSGYPAGVWYAVSEDEGRTWREKGQAVGKGRPGAFDCHGVFTPNILVWAEKYWLYYTAAGEGFEMHEFTDAARTAIGLAAADSPKGPWRKLSDRPVLESTREPERFDSFRVDDTCFVVRGGRIWMYYKGRQWQNSAGNTKMGAAAAQKPEGPFRRLNGGECVQDSGHEVMVWPRGKGVMSLVSPAGPNGRTLQYAPDGVSFRVVGQLPERYPQSPGSYRADLTDAEARGKPITWGVSMVGGDDPYLVRYEIRDLPPAGAVGN
ncbi:MAG: glycoside hydrolase family protein [Planctomycetota bacterium]|jgi:hypothetical protein